MDLNDADAESLGITKLQLRTLKRRGAEVTEARSSASSKVDLNLKQLDPPAEFGEEVAGDVRFCVTPQKAGEHDKKTIFFFSEKFPL